MRIILTGGRGFIGSSLLPLLLESGHEVLALGRNKFLPEGGAHRNFKFQSADLSFLDPVADTLRQFKPEALAHLAWEGIPDYSFSTNLRNFQSSVKLFNLMTEMDCKVMLSTGSCWEYGTLQGRVSERDLSPKGLALFPAFKSSVREVLRSMAESRGARWYWGRIFFSYGPGQRAGALIPSVTKKIAQGESPEIKTPGAVNDFIHVSDVARGIQSLLDHQPDSGIYNIGSGVGTTVSDTVRLITELHSEGSNGRPILPVTTPSALSTASALSTGFWADPSKLRDATGWSPRVTLIDGLRAYARRIPI